MKFSQAKQGRTFIIRLEHGEIVHEALERFAREQSIKAATLVVLGGADRGSKLAVGPQHGQSLPITPMEQTLQEVHEIAGTGTLFSDEEGNPSVHVHMACGRESATVTGCIRTGVKVWHTMEVILFELISTGVARVFDSRLGFKVLNP